MKTHLQLMLLCSTALLAGIAMIILKGTDAYLPIGTILTITFYFGTLIYLKND